MPRSSRSGIGGSCPAQSPNTTNSAPLNCKVCNAPQSLIETILPSSIKNTRRFDFAMACSCLKIVLPSTLADATWVKAQVSTMKFKSSNFFLTNSKILLLPQPPQPVTIAPRFLTISLAICSCHVPLTSHVLTPSSSISPRQTRLYLNRGLMCQLPYVSELNLGLPFSTAS